jgi:glutamyl-tRNA synthetase
MLCPKGSSPETICCLLQTLIWSMDDQEDWTGKGLEKASHDAAEIFGLHHKKIIIPVLYTSLMDKLQGPPLFDSATLLGKDRTRVRLMGAIELLGGISNKKMDQLKKGWGKKDCKELVVTQTAVQ